MAIILCTSDNKLNWLQDPFDAMAKKQVDQFMGNFDTPILVPSATGDRLVGCICKFLSHFYAYIVH